MKSPSRAALVTGASSGIGRSFARLLAARGYDLVLVARRQELLDQLAAELGSQVTVEVLATDLTDPDELALVERRLSDEGNPIELLVNNAGFGSDGAFARLDIERETDMARLHVLTVMRLTHAALGGMLSRGRGGVINVASMAGFQPMAWHATYAATKAFLIRFTEAVALECAPKGVRLTVLCPGFSDTGIHERAGVRTEGVSKFLWRSPDQIAETGLVALERGRVVAIPGWPYRALAATTGVVPRRLIRAVARLGYRRR